MKKTITIILMTFMLIGTASAYEVNTYRGVKVNHIERLCGGNAVGCYFYRGAFKGQMNIAWSENKEHYEDILAHEYAHHIWYAKMTTTERNRYSSLESGRFDKLFEQKGIKMGQCNVSDYATTSVEEDFADNLMVYLSGNYRKTIQDKCDLKIRIVAYYFKKYGQSL